MSQFTQRINLPFEHKLKFTKNVIREWYQHWGGRVYVSFSGGKDSTVLLHIVRSMYPETKGVFSDTGLEYPDIRKFVATFENIDWVRPKKTFRMVLEEHGYPIVSKEQSKYIKEARTSKSKKLNSLRLGTGHYTLSQKWRYLIDAPFKISDRCCYILKKSPLDSYGKKNNMHAMIGTCALESNLRLNSFLRSGCTLNNFHSGRSTPLIYWTEENIWQYIKENNVEICSIYNKGCKRTGCYACLFGHHLQIKEDRDKLKFLHKNYPRLYEYVMEDLDYKTVLEWYPERKQQMEFNFEKMKVTEPRGRKEEGDE